MPLFLLEPILKVLCIVHAVRTGRNTIWVYVLIFLQVIGPIAYFFAEILRRARHADKRYLRNEKPWIDIARRGGAG